PFYRRHPGDLAHAQPGGVVGLPEVLARLLARLVAGVADDAEVLLRRVGAAVALGGRPLGHVVEERLRRRADDRDDVRPGEPRRLGLYGVVVDVARGDDHLAEGRLADLVLCLERLARGPRLVDPLDRERRLARERLARRRRGGQRRGVERFDWAV